MVSFISSFRERSIVVFALAAIVTLAVAWVNNAAPDARSDREFEKQAFWQHKVFGHPDHSYTVIASGDSRVYRGLSPEALESVLPGAKVLNYGFSGSGHNKMMFDQIARLLDEDQSKTRAVILGITPYSLTPKAQKNGEYADYLRKGPPSRLESLHEIFRSLSTRRLKELVLGGEQKYDSNQLYEYLDNGWIKSDWATHDPEAELNVFRTDFRGNQVDPKVLADIAAQTRKWVSAGIIVLAYRPPTTPAMEAVEAEHSGFDEPAFRRQFTQAGGIWVDPGPGYVSYDGSHLTPESSEKLSRILGQAIAGERKSF